MGRVDRTLIQVLEQAAGNLSGLAPENRDVLVSVGASIEQALEAGQDTPEFLATALRAVLTALQAAFEGSVGDSAGVLEDAARTLTAAVACCAAQDGEAEAGALTQAVDALLKDLGDPSSTGPAAKADWTAQAPTLDEASALIVQLELDDDEGLARAEAMLREVAAGLPGPEAAALVIEAARKISEARHQPDSAAENLSEVASLLETAANAIEDGEPPGALSPEVATRAQPGPTSPEPGQPSPTLLGSACQPDDDKPTDIQMLPADADASLLRDFVTESQEYIEGAEAALLTIETDPDDSEAVNTVFRAFHTIKGTSAFLGIDLVSRLAHRAESLLSRIRDGRIRCRGGYADLALRSADVLKALLQSVEAGLGDGSFAVPPDCDSLMQVLDDPEAHGVSEDSSDDLAPPRPGDLLVAGGKASRDTVEAVAETQADELIGVALVRAQAASLPDVAKALRTQQAASRPAAATEASVRVRTDRLDRLIETVGELVIAQSMLAQDQTVIQGRHHELLRKITHSGKIVRELQDLSMSMRMVPLKATFQKMSRLVRDTAHKSGKQATLVTEGDDTEIDRNMVDVIADPLMHMIRNAVDHGVEPPDVRERIGKPASGTVSLSACHAGGSVVVTLRDDGAGLRRDRIVEKAIERGLIETDRGLSDAQVFNLIFEPGFSTAERVTDVSGRGVGMDVVRRGIEALRGRIEIASVPNEGSTFTFRLPLTLAVTDGMLVRVGDERYIVPTVSIYMSFRPDRSALSTIAGCGEMVMLRDELMPVFRVQRVFGIEGAVTDPTEGLLVVVDDADGRYALLVDELMGQQQVVAKSLSEGIGRVQGISGGAILGDGRVGLILDASGISTLARATFAAEADRGALCESVAAALST